MEKGHKWRSFQWQKARDALRPSAMPLMVVKMHVARAHALGLDYPTYAAVRKAAGRDIMGLLFSSNALRIMRADAPQMPVERGEILSAVEGAQKLALVHAPLDAGAVQQCNPVLDTVGAAPKFTDSWAQMREHLGDMITTRRMLSGQVLIIGDTAMERDWFTALRAAGFIEAGRYFAAR